MRPRQLALRGRVSPELAALAAVILWSLAPLFALIGGRGVFNGGYGVDVADLMQYMAFIRDAGQHVLISNRFDVVADRHLFLDPVFALSGLVWRLGASIQFALLWWVPVSLAALWLGFRAYIHRLLGPDRRACAVALLLAFLYLAPTVALADWLGGGAALRFGTQVVGLEMFAGAYAWAGGPAMGIALMPVFLLAVERLLDPSRRKPGRSGRWYGAAAAGTGLLTTWIHPWQGMTLLAIMAGLVVWGRFRRRYASLIVPALLTAAPLGYFFALSHIHSAWMRVSQPNDYAHFGSWLVVALVPAIVAIPGYLGYPGNDLDLQERILRLWPLAGFAVYLALDRTWFYHAFAGLSLPLAVLAVRGFKRLRVPRVVAAVAVLAFVVPGLVWAGQQLARSRDQHFFTASEARALAFLEHARRPGAVLAPLNPLGQAVPAFAGRQTYVGHYYWTPDYNARLQAAESLFDGRLARAQAVAFVRQSGVAFLASDCRRGRVDLRPILGALIERTWRFGCATVYAVSPAAGLQAQIRPASSRRRGVVVL